MSEFLLITKYAITDPRLREQGLLQDAAFCIKDGVIGETGSAAALREKYPQTEVRAYPNHIALPGFVDAHNHGQGLTTLSLGIKDDLLEIFNTFWPGREQKPLQFVYLDALVAASRQIRSGVTTTLRHDARDLPLEMYRGEAGAVLQAYQETGIRFVYSMGLTDRFGWVYGANDAFVSSLPFALQQELQNLPPQKQTLTTQEWQDFTGEVHNRFKDTSRIGIVIGIMGPQWASEELLALEKAHADHLGVGTHGPFLETVYQRMFAEKYLGRTAAEHFYKLGILSPRHSSAHGVWLTESDIELFAETGATVTHCPSSNLRLFSGIAPVPLMLERGVNVALSVDSEGINDDDDTFQEMRLAMLLHRTPGRESRALDAWDVLAMATINGARALNLQNVAGTLEIGKEADIVLVDLERILADFIHPNISLVETLVQRGKPQDIDTVMVAGEAIYQKSAWLRFDEQEKRSQLNGLMKTMPWPPNPEKAALVQKLLPYMRAYYAGWNMPDLKPLHKMNSLR